MDSDDEDAEWIRLIALEEKENAAALAREEEAAATSWNLKRAHRQVNFSFVLQIYRLHFQF